jgi:TatA/E family protein of Tat protein translocase
VPTLSPPEILVVAAIALIVFGPQKLPEIARTLGRAMSELRRMAAEVRSEFDLADVEDEPEEAVPAASAPTEATRSGASETPPRAETEAPAETEPPAESA